MSFLVSFLRSVRFMLKAFRRGDQHTAGRLSVTVFGKSGGGGREPEHAAGIICGFRRMLCDFGEQPEPR